MTRTDPSIDTGNFRRFMDKWITPTTIAILFGAIVWGVQLNVLTMNLVESDAEQNEKIEKLAASINDMSFNTTRQSLIMDATVQKLTKIDAQLAEHIKTAEKWKRRIISNELNLKNGGHK